MTIAVPVRVLLVEDDLNDAKLVSRALAEAPAPGYDLTSVSRLSDALDRLRAAPPQLVILDLGLPDSSGLETLERVARAAPDLPVFVLSGGVDERLGARAIDEGAEDVVAKQPSLPLLPALRRCLDRHGARRRSEPRRDEARFRAVFDSPMMGIHFMDLDGRILDANDYFLRMTGYARADLAAGGLRWTELTPPEHRDADARAVEQLRSTGACEPYRKDFLRKDGSRVPVLMGASLLPGDARRCVGFALDVTRETALEERFLQAQKMEAVGRLAEGVAHDFNNLLTAIGGYAQLALSRLGPEDPNREVLKAGERAGGLTRQLLAFGRRQRLEPLVIDLGAVIVDMDKLLRRLIGEDIDLVTALQDGLGRVRADRTQVEQVVMNLAVNARDAMPRGGKLTIETSDVELTPDYARGRPAVRPGPYVMIAVSDNGQGMDKATLSKIFEPFFTTKAPGRGTGLGLSTVYGIVKQSGGHVGVYSEPGRGSAFKVYLPRVEAKLDVVPTPGAPKPTSALRGTETVLVVEDDDTVRRLTRQVLLGHGYKVLEAGDGAEALAVCTKLGESIDLLLTDVVMPTMSGKALTELVLPLYPRLKALYVSGYTENAVLHQGILGPGVPFLEKPYTPRQLLEKVRHVLGSGVV